MVSFIASVKRLTLKLAKIEISKRETFSLDRKIAILVVDFKGRFFFHLQFPLDGGVEVVFDVVISSSGQILCDFCPFVSVLSMSSYYYLIFLRGPFPSFNFWIQVIVPSLSALFADTTWQKARYDTPIFRSVFFDQLDNLAIFFLCPGAFD